MFGAFGFFFKTKFYLISSRLSYYFFSINLDVPRANNNLLCVRLCMYVKCMVREVLKPFNYLLSLAWKYEQSTSSHFL